MLIVRTAFVAMTLSLALIGCNAPVRRQLNSKPLIHKQFSQGGLGICVEIYKELIDIEVVNSSSKSVVVPVDPSWIYVEAATDRGVVNLVSDTESMDGPVLSAWSAAKLSPSCSVHLSFKITKKKLRLLPRSPYRFVIKRLRTPDESLQRHLKRMKFLEAPMIVPLD